MRTIFLTIVFLVSTLAYAQGKRGPHNGLVMPAGEYNIETIGCDEYLEIYLFDKYMEPMLNYGTSGEVKFFKVDNSGTSVPLVLYGTDGFTAKFPEYNFSTYKVTLVIKGTPYSAKFSNQCIMSN